MYGSWRRIRSQSLCIGELIRSYCALSNLVRFCWYILSRFGDGPSVYGISYGWLEVVLRCLYFRVGVWVRGLFGSLVSLVRLSLWLGG
jgi:hypothetical protein